MNNDNVSIALVHVELYQIAQQCRAREFSFSEISFTPMDRILYRVLFFSIHVIDFDDKG